MIKPVSLWNFLHECDVADAEYVGRICLALAGKDVALTRPEMIQFRTIRKDNNDMNERIDAKNACARERQRKYRAKIKKMEQERDAQSRDVTVTTRDNALETDVTDHPSIRPSIHPSVRPEESESEHAHSEVTDADGRPKTVPTDDEMRAMARGIEIPADYVATFVANIRSSGWGYVNRGGTLVQLNRRNCKAVMRTFYNQHKKNTSASQPSEHGVTARGTEYVEGIANGLGI